MTDYYMGTPVTILRRFSGTVIICDPNDRTGKSRLVLPETSINFGTPAPLIPTTAPKALPPTQMPVVEPTVVPVSESAGQPKFKVDINNMVKKDIAAASRAIPGLGVRTFELLLQNRPQLGYTDFAEMKELNKKEAWASLNWDQLEEWFAFVTLTSLTDKEEKAEKKQEKKAEKEDKKEDKKEETLTPTVEVTVVDSGKTGSVKKEK